MKSERLRIVLTGATGFVGRAILEAWCERHQVTCVTRAPISFPSATTITGELTPETLKLLPRQVDVVIHVAGVTAIEPDNLFSALQVGVLASRWLAEYCHSSRASLFVFASSGSVYPKREQPWSEDEHFVPELPYGAFKLAGEHAATLPGLPTLLLRLFHPYGPGQRDKFLIPRLMKNVMAGDPITMNADGSPRFSCLYITDLVRILERMVLARTTGTFNVAGPVSYSVGELIDILEPMLDKTALRQINEQRNASLIAETTRLRQAFPSETYTDLATGLGNLLRAMPAIDNRPPISFFPSTGPQDRRGQQSSLKLSEHQ